jgi:hypothetical protein
MWFMNVECGAKETDILSCGKGAAIWSKLTLRLLAIITLSTRMHHFQSFLPFFKFILEVVFYDAVQHCLRFTFRAQFQSVASRPTVLSLIITKKEIRR